MKRRMLIISLCICLILSGSLGRIGFIIFNESSYVGKSDNYYTLTIDTNEPNILYSDFSALTNNTNERYAVIRPNEKDIIEAEKLFKNEEYEDIINELKSGKPVIRKIADSFTSENIKTYNVKNSNYLCKQLISEQSSGLLNHINANESKLKIRFSVDAMGRTLSGDIGTVINDNYYNNSSIRLTLDKEVEKSVYESCERLTSGCVIVADVKTSKILACITKPDDCYINKPLELYCVGSVFKIVTCLTALENGVDNEYECRGKIKVGDKEFSCQKGKKHGKQDMKTALANSCNCYFINLALTLGSEQILNTAKSLGFDGYTKLYNGWTIKNAKLPSRMALSSKGETALFGFGQGALLATPLQLCSLLCTIGNGGIYKPMTIIEEELDDNHNSVYVQDKSEKRVISEYDSKLMLSYLRNVVENGTGKSADNNNQSSGKTATAQTGQFDNGKEILNTYFAGLYPYDNPTYAIVIMCDNGTSGAHDCCPIFKDIVEKLEKK